MYTSVPDSVVVGEVGRYLIGTLEVTQPSGPVHEVNLQELLSLEISPGKARVRSAAIGAGVGMLLGLVTGMTCSDACAASDARFVPVIGAALGASLGAAVGAFVLAPDTWYPIDLRLVR